MAKESTPKPPVLEKPDHVNEQNAGGFGDPAEQDNSNDPDFVQPNTDQKVVQPAVSNQDPGSMLESLFTSPTFQRLVAAEVEKRLAREGVDTQRQPRFIQAAQQGPASQRPVDFQYLKHYRNDSSPDLVIQELNMEAEVPQLEPIVGRKMRFRRGHFYATTENQVKQIEFMIHQATHSADGTRVLGGISGIYEDDGEVLYHCTAGCPLDQFIPTGSKQRYAAHMRSVHNVNVEV